MKKLIAVSASAVLLASWSGIASAQDYDNTVTGDRAGDMLADLLIVRPVGLVGSVLGAVGWVVTLPFTLPTGSADEAGRELVGKPLEYTFYRPLGDFERCGADRHACGAW